MHRQQISGTTLRTALVSRGLFFTLAMAQPVALGQTLICTQMDANDYCIEAKAQDNTRVTVRVEDGKVSENITCVTDNGLTTCTKVTVTQ